MNVHDSEHVRGVLQDAGYEPAASVDEADVVVFNTCCVRQSAEDRVWGNLGAIASAPRRTVAVCGCMAQKHGAGILQRARAVNLVFGMDALGRLPQLIEMASEAPVCDLGDVGGAMIDPLPTVRGSRVQAWVPVSHGCDNNCSYCVVPGVRGPERSRTAGDVLAEVERLAADGVVEVVLLGQNVNSYGRDLGRGPAFAELLAGVAAVPGIRRVKFETSHPRDLTEDVLDVMAGSPEVCEYLHLPVQSGSDAVLEAMNRGYGRDEFLELAQRARKKVPGLTLTTDIIVGFPTETDKDFVDTMELVREVEFDAAYLFLYSPREGTPAAGMTSVVTDEQRRSRFDELVRAQDEITARSLGKIVGRDVEVIVDGLSRRGNLFTGRTRGHRVVLIEPEKIESPLVTVRVHGAGKHSLRGKIADPGEAPVALLRQGG